MNKMSMSQEDYLEAILELSGNNRVSVRSVDLASKLDVSKASVNKAVGLLKENGYITQQPYGDINLTDSGIQYATKVLNRHILLYSFLTQALGVDPQIADEEACKMEHAISEESFEKWLIYAKKANIKPTPPKR